LELNVNVLYKLIVALTLLVSQHVNAIDPGKLPPVRQESANPRTSCSEEDFSSFIRRFADNEAIQRAFIKYPLTKQRLDPDAEPEPKKIIRRLRREQIQFPILPLSPERAKRSLEIRVVSATGTSAQINLVKPDTDYQVSYFFEKNGCWRLVKIEDWSL
jgi:hypothetical protein